MKHVLLAITAAAAMSAASAAPTVEFQWAKVIDDGTAGMSSVEAVTAAPNDSYYIGTLYNVTNATVESANWSGHDVTPAGGYESNYQKQLTIGLIDHDGIMNWHITANFANILNNSLSMATQPDGNLIVAASATFNKNGAGAPTLLKFTDNYGKNVTITAEGTPEGKSPYTGVVVAFSPSGAYLWSRTITATEYETAGAFDMNTIAIKDVATDQEGRIYVAGVYHSQLNLGNNIASRYAINLGVESNGKTYNNGDAFIARYTKDGAFDKLLTSTSAIPYAAKEALEKIVIDGNALYCAALVDAAGSLKYNLFNKEVEGLSTDCAANVVYGKVDLETFTCTEAGVLTANKNSAADTHNAMIKDLTVQNGCLFISGCNQGNLEQEGTVWAESAVKSLQDYAIAVDLNTFKATASYATKPAAGISYTFSVLCDDAASKIYTLSMALTGSKLALYEFDAAGGAAISSTTLAVGANNIAPGVFNNQTKRFLQPIYAKSLTDLPGGAEVAETFSGFHGFLACYKFDDITGLETIGTAEPGAAPGEVEYYNLQGMRVANPAKGTIVISRRGDKVSKIRF